MPQVRRAGPGDAAELTRLRVVMFTDMGRDPGLLDADWRRRNVAHCRSRLAETDAFAAYVVDLSGGGMAACAVGWLNDHLIGTANQTGRVGYVASMSTDPAYRRRGYGRATSSRCSPGSARPASPPSTCTPPRTVRPSTVPSASRSPPTKP